MGHKVGVIGGDGIGPEVIAEALKVVRAAGVALDTTDYDLGGARYLRDGTILPDEVLEEWRGLDALLLGAVGTPGVPPGRDRAGPAAQDALRARPLHQPAALHVPGERHRHGRHPREHRGPVRRRGRRAAQGHPPRGRHPGIGQHPPRRRALRPLRLRAGREPAPQAPHARAQDERPHLRRRPLGAHLQRGRRRAPRRHHRLQPRRRRLHLLRAVTRSSTTSSSPTTSSATSSPTSAARYPGGSGSPRAAT